MSRYTDQQRIDKANHVYEAFRQANQGSMPYKGYLKLVARTDRVLTYAIEHVRRYDCEAKDFTPDSKKLARKWWAVRDVHYALELDRLSQRLLDPHKRTDSIKNLVKEAEGIEKERNFMKGSLKILYGIQAGD